LQKKLDETVEERDKFKEFYKKMCGEDYGKP
jgi:hypothetical protein